MPIEQIYIGDSKNKVIESMGSDIGSANINGTEILTFDSKVDNLANYVYLRDGKVVLVSQGKGKQVASTVDTLFPEIELPDKSYFYKPEQRATVVRYTIHIWEQKGLAVIIDGSKSNDKVERVLLFEPGSEQNLRSVWTTAKYIGEETVFLPVSAKTQFVEQPQAGESTQLLQIPSLPIPYTYVGIGILAALVFGLVGVVLVLKKKKHGKNLNTNVPATTQSNTFSEASTLFEATPVLPIQKAQEQNQITTVDQSVTLTDTTSQDETSPKTN